ncbi:nucleotide-binding domain containing protein, partial [Streptomyces sp. NPDC060205]|uniref:nucleotide-binding domain containing protein n=1 Tax=Streptomyces sp. NPDC060205 TaxID=3347072 RepID=UPI003648B25B
AAAGRIAVCDAETDADLDAVAGAALRTAPAMRLVGSGGLAAAVRRTVTPVGSAESAASVSATVPGGSTGPRATADDGGRPAPRGAEPRPVLVVVGTAEPSAVEQVGRLVRAGAAHLALSETQLFTPAGPLTLPHPSSVTVVTIAPHVAPTSSRRLAQALATAVATAVERHSAPLDLVLTGGETARRTLDALGVTELEALGQVHHGAVLCAAPDGRAIVTRPGSFGDADSLLHIVRALTSAHLP